MMMEERLGNSYNQQALKNLLTESYLEDEHKNL
jgi:hypothetical protein